MMAGKSLSVHQVSQPAVSHAHDLSVVRGADVLATRCLCVTSGERVHLLSWHLEDLCQVVEAALWRAGASVERVMLEPLADLESIEAARELLAPQFEQVTASVLIAADGIPVHVGM